MLKDAASANRSKLIDLHSHTTASDGTLSPAELVTLAKQLELGAIGITDHDTFAGYEQAVINGRDTQVDIVRGIELNTKLTLEDGTRRTAHLLAYWPVHEPSDAFNEWLSEQQDERRSRNMRLAKALQARNVKITVEEVEARGRSLAGRPHFARILVDKGYAKNQQEAFDRFLGESAPSFVERQSQTTEEAIAMVRNSGGVPVIAHPIRLSLSRNAERSALFRLKEAGLIGLEIYHSEHTPELQAHYRQLAEQLTLLPTGGSDFHGAVKPDIQLGTGTSRNIRVPFEFLENMRQFVQ